MTSSPQIIKSLPPNFSDIVKVFPMARGVNVIFAHYPNIYTRGHGLTPELVAHESVHLERQKEMGVKDWWAKYLSDPQFRYDEELLAHVAEYKHLCTMLSVAAKREKALKHVTNKLASGLYNHMVTPKMAREAIIAGAAA